MGYHTTSPNTTEQHLAALMHGYELLPPKHAVSQDGSTHRHNLSRTTTPQCTALTIRHQMHLPALWL